jgi:hypothetical protein
VRLARDVGERRAGTMGRIAGYYVDSGVVLVVFADGSAAIPGDAIDSAAEGRQPRPAGDVLGHVPSRA